MKIIVLWNKAVEHSYWNYMADFIGWIATVIMMFGSIGVAHKKIIGLWLFLVGNILWIVVAYMTNLWSLAAVSVILGVLDGYGIHKWKTI